MSRTKLLFTLLLSIVAILLLGWTLTDFNQRIFKEITTDDETPTYQTENMVTLAYEPTGHLGYRLESVNVTHYADQKETWFTSPIVTMYDTSADAIWQIKADEAKLISTKILYLFGHVEADNINAQSQLQKIITDNAAINLVSLDIMSDDRVTLTGQTFSSSGIRMRGNLRSKTAELLEQVVTSIAPQNKSN